MPRKIILKPWNKKSKKFLKKAAKRQRKLTHSNPAENWFARKICKDFPYTFQRQVRYGYRIFDFYNAQLHVAIEIDGKQFHQDQAFDQQRDEAYTHNYGVVIFRVRAFSRDDYGICLGNLKKIRPSQKKEKKKPSPNPLSNQKCNFQTKKNKFSKHRKLKEKKMQKSWKEERKLCGFYRKEYNQPSTVKRYTQEQIAILQKNMIQQTL